MGFLIPPRCPARPAGGPIFVEISRGDGVSSQVRTRTYTVGKWDIYVERSWEGKLGSKLRRACRVSGYFFPPSLIFSFFFAQALLYNTRAYPA